MNHNPFVRRLNILSILQSSTQPLTVNELIARLEEFDPLYSSQTSGGGRDPREKQIQRDLVFLRDECSLPVEEEPGYGKALLWSFGDNKLDVVASVTKDTDIVLSMILASKFLARFLPLRTRIAVNSATEAAEGRLARREDQSKQYFSLLSQRIAFDQRGGRLAAPEIDQATMDTIVDAIVRERRVTFQYNHKKREGSINGILIKEPKTYLLVQLEQESGTSKPIQFLAHRVQKLQIIDRKSRVDRSFSMQAYVNEWLTEPFVLKDQGYKTLHLQVQDIGNLAADLKESGIGVERQILPSKRAGYVEFKSKVKFTYPVLEWLLARGGDIKVLGDKDILRVVKERIKEAAKQYK